jgi:hypothetical protein
MLAFSHLPSSVYVVMPDSLSPPPPHTPHKTPHGRGDKQLGRMARVQGLLGKVAKLRVPHASSVATAGEAHVGACVCLFPSLQFRGGRMGEGSGEGCSRHSGGGGVFVLNALLHLPPISTPTLPVPQPVFLCVSLVCVVVGQTLRSCWATCAPLCPLRSVCRARSLVPRV